jgi:hypothetical protein
VESADLAASIYLQTKPPPELDVISEKRIDQLDRDWAPGPRPAEEYLTHPARPKTTDQNIMPDSPRVSWPKGIHATRHRKGIADAANPPEPDDSRNRSPRKTCSIAPTIQASIRDTWPGFYVSQLCPDLPAGSSLGSSIDRGRRRRQ